MVTKATIRPMLAEDLSCVLRWRNHRDIRRFMYSQHEISEEEHVNWFKRASSDVAKHILIFESNCRPAGFVQFSELPHGQAADWGFYKDPNAPSGTGRKLGISALDHAFLQIGFHKICGQALAFNEHSVNFHKTMGFRTEGSLRDQHFDGERFYDVICFGLLKSEWQQGELSQAGG